MDESNSDDEYCKFSYTASKAVAITFAISSCCNQLLLQLNDYKQFCCSDIHEYRDNKIVLS